MLVCTWNEWANDCWMHACMPAPMDTFSVKSDWSFRGIHGESFCFLYFQGFHKKTETRILFTFLLCLFPFFKCFYDVHPTRYVCTNKTHAFISSQSVNKYKEWEWKKWINGKLASHRTLTLFFSSTVYIMVCSYVQLSDLSESRKLENKEERMVMMTLMRF